MFLTGAMECLVVLYPLQTLCSLILVVGLINTWMYLSHASQPVSVTMCTVYLQQAFQM